ncbi:MAG: restriction endonuclease subunit S [Deltaproteobacteria bacterium]|nr:restriction endonuclease subunit S [Deltaproteobacteria bacterium]
MTSKIALETRGWRTVLLESVMEAIIDYRGKSPQKSSSGVPLITAKIVKDGRILPAEEFIAPEDYDDWMRRGIPLRGDVVITTEAPLGEVAQLDGRKVALAQRIIAIRGKSGVLDNTFLKFLLRSAPVQASLRSRSTGTTVLGIRQSELRQVSLSIPPFEEQRNIAHTLGTLDDKIELNRKMNETLEAMARALFKSWFIDFDPVRAKAEGRDPGLPARIADLFPDSFQDSELGQIPVGWRAGYLRDVAENPRRTINPNVIVKGTPYIALEHMPRESIALSSWENADAVESSKFAFKAGEVLFGKLRPYFHKVGVAPVDGVCSTDIVVIAPKTAQWFGFVLGHASSHEFVGYANAGSTGTKMPRTNWTDMSRYPVALPSEELAQAFTTAIHPMIDRIITAIHECRELAQIRDALLPKLMSGELRISTPDPTAEVNSGSRI